MITKTEATEIAINACRELKNTPILDTLTVFRVDVWEIIIFFDEYDNLGVQVSRIYAVDPETGEVTPIYLL